MELQQIQSKIYEIRGYRVMLDFDLAGMYQVETKVLNQAVKRNMNRFPSDFMFQITKEEWYFLKSQIVTLESGRGKFTKYLPFAFTEHGVAMLSGVLKSDIAIQVNISIIRTFVAMRELVLNLSPTSSSQKEIKELREYVEDVFADQNDINEDTRLQLELINEAIAELQVKKKILDKPRNPIGYIHPKKK